MRPGDDDLAPTAPALPIGAAVEHLLKARGLEATAVLADILTCWDETVGRDVAVHVTPVGLRQGELIVEVDEPAWATQVQLLGSLVLARLADQLGPGAPQRLSVRVGRPRRRSDQGLDGREDPPSFPPASPGRPPPTR